MGKASKARRVDTASLVIAASPESIYQALVDPEALMARLPPDGMSAELCWFDARPGGAYRMILTYEDAGRHPGKSSEATDVVQVRFVELIPGERIVQRVAFEADDPAFGGEMTMTWALSPQAEGVRVTIRCEDVPEGIRPDDHQAGMTSSLANLAAYVEARIRPASA